MTRLKMGLAAAALTLSAGLFALPATAAPATGLSPLSTIASKGDNLVQEARHRRRCWKKCWRHRGHWHCRWHCRRRH